MTEIDLDIEYIIKYSTILIYKRIEGVCYMNCSRRVTWGGGVWAQYTVLLLDKRKGDIIPYFELLWNVLLYYFRYEAMIQTYNHVTSFNPSIFPLYYYNIVVIELVWSLKNYFPFWLLVVLRLNSLLIKIFNWSYLMYKSTRKIAIKINCNIFSCNFTRPE